MKGTGEREKDRCRDLESGTRSGKWRWMDNMTIYHKTLQYHEGGKQPGLPEAFYKAGK